MLSWGIRLRWTAALAVLLALQALPVLGQGEEKPKDLKYLTAQQVRELVPQILKLHLLRPELDAEHMRRLMKKFLEQLDPSRTAYIQSEVEARTKLSDAELLGLATDIRQGKLDFFVTWAKQFKEEILARDNGFVADLPKIKEQITGKIEKAEWEREKARADNFPETQENRHRRLVLWMNQKYQLFRDYLTDEEAFQFAQQDLKRSRDKWTKFNPELETPTLVMKSLMLALDPHSEYMDAEDVAEFDTAMAREFSGVGLQIRGCPLGAQVEKVIDGGPAAHSKQFDAHDQIIQVDDTPVAGMELSEIVKRMKGPRGTEVKLVLKKAKPTADGKPLIVPLKRDTIDLTELKVTSKKFDTPAGAVGQIYVANFYPGVSGDVAERVRQLSKDAPLAGLILDLRGNGGGLLEEAVKMAGLFVTSGPVVAARDFLGRKEWLYDRDDGQIYTGPVIILVNQFTASAAEIVSGALRDYGRGIIFGSSQTHGKGSVQRVIDLAQLVHMPGRIKITFQQYFLAGGESVQNKGVEPEIIVPGPKLIEDWLERKQDGAIPWAQIPGRLDDDQPDCKLYRSWKEKVLPELKEKSAKRVAEDKAFDIFRKMNTEGKDGDAPLKDDKDLAASQATAKEGPDPQLDEAVKVVQDAARLWSQKASVTQ
jgi:carboxyl-terminal processing protease